MISFDPNMPDMKTTDSALPDIYVEEDLKRIQAKNKEIVKKNEPHKCKETKLI